MTREKRAIRYLQEARGAKEVLSRSRKYRMLKGPAETYHVGRAGAVLIGATVTAARSVTDFIWGTIELWEQERGL